MREIMRIVLKCAQSLRFVAVLVSLTVLGCHAQTAAKGTGNLAVQAGVKLSPAMERRVEVMIRNRSEVTPDYTITIGVPATSEVQGFDRILISFTGADGHTSKELPFLLSADGKTLAQFNKFDMSEDPRTTVSIAGRPARGGGENAPVQIVVFDDLECPYCAKMNTELMPAILARYKDQIHLVYRDFPLDQHPWAMHAAVDANCLAAGSAKGYWNYVDYVHAHSGEMGADEKSLAKSEQTLDKLALDEGARQGVNQTELVACVLKQDDAKVKASVAEGLGDPLHLGSAPVIFINGEKVEGVTPVETLDRVIDRALTAEGKTPPPPPPTPVQPSPAPAASQATPAAAKPGS